MAMNLFDEADDTEDISKIETNQEFARRYEHNKKREDLQRLEELKKKGLASESDEGSESDEEDEDEDMITSGMNDICDVILKLKNKDPIIFQKDAKLYKSDDDEEEEEEEEESQSRKKEKKKKKPMHLKDVIAKQLLEKDSGFEKKKGGKSYVEEQEEIRRQFLSAAEEALEGGEDDEDLLKEKGRKGAEEEEVDDELQKKLNQCLDGDDVLTEYVLNIVKDKGVEKELGGVEDLGTISEDEEEVEKQEKYETEYNYRFQEGAGDRVVGHARVTEGSVRKKTNARKLQRERKEERMMKAQKERDEEVKYLKNLKSKEIVEKLEKIRATGGISEEQACVLNEDDLDEDFDPEKYDMKMKEVFDEGYYKAEDADPGFCSDGDDFQKPDFDKEDDLLGLPKGWDESGSGDGFTAAREKFLKLKAQGKDVDVLGDDKEEELPEDGKRKRKRKISLAEKVALDKELEEYYKLDYEDTIGDLKVRFRYTSVPPNKFGMSTKTVLTTDDKELNQEVSLKKIAPYMEKEWVVRKKKTKNDKEDKFHDEGVNLKDHKGGKKKHLKDKGNSTTVPGDLEQVQPEGEASNGEVRTESRKTRRKHRLAELKLTNKRLIAYGKLQPKKKKQH